MNGGHDAVILAAGGSRRLGHPKQLLISRGETLVSRITRLVLETRPARTLVIVGAQAAAVSAALEGKDVEVVTNGDWASGLASSLGHAARALAGRNRPVLVTVVDQPALEARHFSALLAAHGADRDTVTAYGDGLGVPAVLRASTLAGATALQGDKGFRQLWAETAPRAVPAEELSHDLDEESDVTRAMTAGWLDGRSHADA